MPFTISHVAAVLPFSRWLARWRLLSAAVIGSMVPDFGFLMPWRPARVETHGAVALITFCLPVGLATFWIFQQWIKTPLMAVLPDATYARWREFSAPANLRDLGQWLMAASGVLAGAVTHLVWDGFTHEGARGIRMIPALDEPSVDIAGHQLAGVRLLQDVSSLIGLAVVLLIIAYGMRRGSRREKPPERDLPVRERYAWIATCAVLSALLGAVFLLRHYPRAPLLTVSSVAARCAIAALRGFACALLAVSLCLGIRLRANRERSARSE